MARRKGARTVPTRAAFGTRGARLGAAEPRSRLCPLYDPGAGTKTVCSGSPARVRLFPKLACDLDPMASAQKFRGYVQDCLRWAAVAQTEPDRHMLLRMAQTREQAAQQIERSVGLICESRALLDRIRDVPPPVSDCAEGIEWPRLI